MPAWLRRLTDGVLFQALITGSLSFAHIHDLADRCGQTGWKAWTYPLSVDLLSVAAYRKMRRDRADGNPVLLSWVCFLMALGASLAANVIATGTQALPKGIHPPQSVMANFHLDPASIAVGVWPALAFLACTLLGHVKNTPAVAVADTEQDSHQPSQPTIERTTVDRLTAETPAAAAPAPIPIAATAIASTPALPAPPPAALPPVNPDLLTVASRVAAEHVQRHDAPITVLDLQRRLSITPALANNLHAHLTAAAAA